MEKNSNKLIPQRKIIINKLCFCLILRNLKQPLLYVNCSQQLSEKISKVRREEYYNSVLRPESTKRFLKKTYFKISHESLVVEKKKIVNF